MLGLPAVVYLAGFVAMTWPWARRFSTAFWCDEGDGYQNVWNLWWVRRAVLAGRSPWWTPLLHAPSGTTLLGHTLNPFNGLLGLPLAAAGLSPVQVHNAIVAFSFVAAGTTAYWLALDVTGGAIFASLVGGFAFTFGEFHFAHAQGHLQLVAVEWLPLFLLAWRRLVREATVCRGALAGVVLGLVLLCDYYYFFYAVLIAAGQVAVEAATPVGQGRLRRWTGLLAFAMVAAAACGPVVAPLVRLHLVGAHPAGMFSADLLGPFVPGPHSWMGRWTRPAWSRWVGGPNEASVYLGWTVLALAAAGLWWSRRWRWAALGVTFAALAMGPGLRAGGRPVLWHGMPYAGLAWAVPPLRVSGMPVRMMVVPLLAASVLAACGTAELVRRRQWWAGVIALAVAVDLWPAPLPTAAVAVPAWVYRLRDLPGPGAVLDVTDTGLGQHLYDQTVHGKPLAFGYVSRVDRRVRDVDAALLGDIGAGRWADVRDRFGIRYLVTTARPPRGVVCDVDGRRIVDLRLAGDALGPVTVNQSAASLVPPD